MKFIERYKAVKRNSTQDKVHKAGDVMAAKIMDQIHEGQHSPFQVEIKNRTVDPDEKFLLRSTTRAVERLSAKCANEELPLYDERATLLANHESDRKELTVIFTRPSEA